MAEAVLVLSDGSVFKGQHFGAAGTGLDVACAACAPSAPSKPWSASAPKPAPELRSRFRLDVGVNSILLS